MELKKGNTCFIMTTLANLGRPTADGSFQKGSGKEIINLA